MTRAISRARTPRGDADRTPVRRTSVVRRWAGRRSDTAPPATTRRPEVPATAVADDCGRRLVRWRDRAHTPPSVAWHRDRERTYTTGLRPGSACPRGPSA